MALLAMDADVLSPVVKQEYEAVDKHHKCRHFDGKSPRPLCLGHGYTFSLILFKLLQ